MRHPPTDDLNPDALLFEHGEEHQAVFNDHVPQQSGKFLLRDKGMDTFVAQQCIEATGELVLLFRKELAVLEKCQRRIPLADNNLAHALGYGLPGFDVRMFIEAAYVPEAFLPVERAGRRAV